MSRKSSAAHRAKYLLMLLDATSFPDLGGPG
jgi:hypothetical protein